MLNSSWAMQVYMYMDVYNIKWMYTAFTYVS